MSGPKVKPGDLVCAATRFIPAPGYSPWYFDPYWDAQGVGVVLAVNLNTVRLLWFPEQTIGWKYRGDLQLVPGKED